ncbi:MAG: hypothetical protein AAF990_15025 [Bacteroidota bacterium]
MKNAFKADALDLSHGQEEKFMLGAYLGPERWSVSIRQGNKVFPLSYQVATRCFFSPNGKILPAEIDRPPQMASLSLYRVLECGSSKELEAVLPTSIGCKGAGEKLEISHGDCTYRICEMLALQLSYIKKEVRRFVGIRLSQICISVPQSYGAVQKKWLLQAGRSLGLEVRFRPMLVSLAGGFGAGMPIEQGHRTAICAFEERLFHCVLVEEGPRQEKQLVASCHVQLDQNIQIVAQILDYWLAINNIAPKEAAKDSSFRHQMETVAWKVIRRIQEEYSFKETLQKRYNCQLSIERFHIFLQAIAPQITQCFEGLLHKALNPAVNRLIVTGPLAHIRYLQQQVEKCLSHTAIQAGDYQQLYASGATIGPAI